jgi:hypothetical protein
MPHVRLLSQVSEFGHYEIFSTNPYFSFAVVGMWQVLIFATISERFFGAKVAPQNDTLFESS